MAENTSASFPRSSITENVIEPTQENLSYNKNGNFVESRIVEILPENEQEETVQKIAEKPNMNISNSMEEDTSSSDLKWDSLSITSMQSGMTQFDTIEDVSYAIGTY